LQVVRNSNLAHLLAISGLHMGLLTGFVFALVRYGLSMLPFVALRVPVRKIAAVASLGVATGYLLLSGSNVATQRAFVMVGTMLLAILMDRRALTLRAVALAAVIVLLLRPESLIQAGFQMSFAATTALVSVFAALNRWPLFTPGGRFPVRFGRMILTLMLSSAVAGGATAPFSAFNFNQIAQYGLIANLLSVPMMGFVVMPSAVIAILLTPLGLSAPFWTVMGAGIEWILAVATQVASLDGAIFYVMKPAGYVLVLISTGALVLILVRGRVRVIGLLAVLIGFVLWQMASRPDILVAENGQLIGVMTPAGRWVSRAKGNGFAARVWLKNDGDPIAQEQAASRLPPLPKYERRRIMVNGVSVLLVTNKKRAANTAGKSTADRRLGALSCAGADLLIAPRQTGENLKCRLVTATTLKARGAVAITLTPDNIQIIGARDVTGMRLWTPSNGRAKRSVRAN
jgi:competence protein ComEC